MGKYNVTIGLEMHCEISETNSKVFSSAKNSYSDVANSNIRPLDMGFPGTLPVLNKEAVRMSLMMSQILNCRQPEYMYFERKNYYYPDMPKNYQITQNPPEDCVGMNGYIDIIRDDGSTFRVGIDNIHLEEDAASMNHLYDTSVIDYNRAGVPLLELVTEPCIKSADDAVSFLEYIRAVYQYCGISEADSKKGQIRCDVNVSISEDDKLGTKVEIKNVNSFGGVHDAIIYEIKRQSELKDAGRYDEVVQETRRYDEESGTTIHMRSKVDAIDYKYFVEPNIPRYKISKEWLDEIRNSIPELPYERKEKYITSYGLSDYDAAILIKDINIAKYFEKCIELSVDAKTAANWIISNILGYTYKYEIDIQDLFLTPERLSVITTSVKDGKISSKQAKELFFMVLEQEKDPDVIMKEVGMQQISDDGAIISVIKEVLVENPNQIAEYKNGKTNMFDYFVGQVMKKTRGQANPVKVKEVLTEELSKM
ncbi:MAG: Asp-tRNA(Asn)/Glu-tRNA(Gln) amidotransferase subunit GatB [Erysipelotrichales bacterium]|nr:Asp-tRNA(Asn)/Glu-tRNA(Gln) amidotransferase subunit GatB [Erysipelotrichales bacterium]